MYAKTSTKVLKLVTKVVNYSKVTKSYMVQDLGIYQQTHRNYTVHNTYKQKYNCICLYQGENETADWLRWDCLFVSL